MKKLITGFIVVAALIVGATAACADRWGEGSAMEWIVKSAAYTARGGDNILCDTSGDAVTVTLPASPSAGDTVRIFDTKSYFDTNNLTVGRNGNKIRGAASNLTVSTENALIVLVYTDSTTGWQYILEPSSGSGSGDVTTVGDCASGDCLDGSSDGGTYASFYDGDSNYTKIKAGNSSADLTFTFPTAYAAGNNYLVNSSTAGVLGYTDPATFQAASATLTSLAGLTETNGGLPYGTADNTYAWLAAGATGKLFMAKGAAAPEWTPYTFPATVPTVGKVLISDGTNLIGSTALGTAAYTASDDYQAASANLTTFAGIAPSANVQTLLGSADYAAFRTNLSLVPGTDVQAVDAELTGLAALAYSEASYVRMTAAGTFDLRTYANVLSDIGAGDVTGVLDDTGGDVPALIQSATAFTINDETPSVSGHSVFITANAATPTTITDFDDPTAGQIIFVIINDVSTTIDFTSSGIEGRDADYTCTNGECLIFVYASQDSQWHYLGNWQKYDADLTAIAALTPAENKIMVGNSTPAWSLSAYTLAAPGTAGNIMYSDGTNWVTLAKDAGKFLKSGDSAVSWDTPAGSGDVTGVGDCASGDCLDGSSDGGTYISLYDGDSNYTKIMAGNSSADLTFTFPTAYAAGNNYLVHASTAGVLGYTDPATFQGADADLGVIAGLSPAEGKIIIADSDPKWALSAFKVPAPSTSGNIMKSDGTNWTSSNSLSIATLDMTSSTSSIPCPVGTAAAPTDEGKFYWNSTNDALTVGNGAAAEEMVTLDNTQTLTNKTLDANGTGNVLKGYGYITLRRPNNRGSATTAVTTTETDINYGMPTFADDVESNNYIDYFCEVPRDIDTAVDLVAWFKFRLGGADTADHDYIISMVSIADSAAQAGTPGNAINLSYSADASGASGDVETAGGDTLTDWKANVTAGNLWMIRITRDGDDGTNDASTVDSYPVELTIRYGWTQ